MKYVFLVVGFALLVVGANMSVSGASDIARKLKVSPLIIGLTVVAMGTSLPELCVSLDAAIRDSSGIAVGNVTGSNLFNLLFIGGICAVMCTMPVHREAITRDLPFSCLATYILIIIAMRGKEITRIGAAILLVLFIFYMYNILKKARQQNVKPDYYIKPKKRKKGSIIPVEEREFHRIVWSDSIWLCILVTILGGIAIGFGGDFTVNSASSIARYFGLSENMIGLTIVAVSTSLPELVTSIVAASKKEMDMVFGNIVGSNIFNALCILGISALVKPISVSTYSLVDLGILTMMSLIVWIMSIKKEKISRPLGLMLVIIYIVYMVFVCLR